MRYFLIYFFLEVMISVEISSVIGGFATFLEIIFSAFFGAFLLANFRQTLAENFRAVSQNCLSLDEFQRLNLFTLIGALLLILPGFLSDIIGLLMQFSVVTQMFVTRYSQKYGKNCKTNFNKKDDDVIDVEILSSGTTSDK
jgi:2-isopropylmalate synthase/UPF0716 protein FxsA